MKQLLLIILLLIPLQIHAQTSPGEIQGVVTAQADNKPLIGVNVYLIINRTDTTGAVTDTAGTYRIPNIPVGTHRLEATHIGFRKRVIETITIQPGVALTQNIVLRSSELSLEEIVVNPGTFSVLEDDPIAPRGLTQKEIQAIPTLTQDIFRSVERLPGVSGSDFLARFTVRGGDYDQVLVTLDGIELFEPFHLKDLGGGVLSIVDAETIGGLNMLTGGFSAEYGDRQSAVLQMRSKKPELGKRVSVGAGIMNAKARVELANENTGLLFSFRRGYTDILMSKIDPSKDLSPEYYDMFGKLTYATGDNHTVGIQGLWAADSGQFNEIDGDNFQSAYGNGYLWLTWDAIINSGFVFRALPYYGRITQDREATFFNADGDAHELIDDIRTTTLYGFKTDAKWQFHKNHLFRFGADIQNKQTDYDYLKRDRRLTDILTTFLRYRGVAYDTQQITLTPSGWEQSAYFSYKWRIFSPLTTDFGLRYDRHTHTDDRKVSPRIGFALFLSDQTALRTAWGRYYQSQDLSTLDVRNGFRTFQPSALATHYTAGLEHNFPYGLQIRLETYHKAYRNIWTRFENINQSHTTNPLPDTADGWFQVYPDRGTAQGIELYIKRDTGQGLNWWASYALTTTHETHRTGVGDPGFRGQELPRAFDQTHSISFDLIYRPRSDWFIGTAWQFRSGWPFTPLELVETPSQSPNPNAPPNYSLTYGDFYSSDLPLYHRLDIKVTHWAEYDNWRLVFGLGLSNIYNRYNVRRYSYFIDQGRLRRVLEGWLPALPFFNVSAEF